MLQNVLEIQSRLENVKLDNDSFLSLLSFALENRDLNCGHIFMFNAFFWGGGGLRHHYESSLTLFSGPIIGVDTVGSVHLVNPDAETLLSAQP